MKAYAVIGASFGDEGKGNLTDYLCATKHADLVVRFSGGAQAGHTVTTPDGKRHVFHHFGSGTLLGVPTFLSEYFIVNPLQFMKEHPDLQAYNPVVYVDPRALVTTPWDMLVNQAYERKLGRKASCGIGINETMQRTKAGYRLTVDNMLDLETLAAIRHKHVPKRCRELGIGSVNMFDNDWLTIYWDAAINFKRHTKLAVRPPGETVVFEGAQGLLLDQNSLHFPHVTHANTGKQNAVNIVTEWGGDHLELIYVTRSYLTRHGAGPLPGEEPLPSFVKDDTNIDHEFQGVLRYAPLNTQALEWRILMDAGPLDFSVAVTCMDQLTTVIPNLPVRYHSYGPTRDNVFARR